MLGEKLDHQVKSYKNLVYALEATFSVQYAWNLVTMFVLMISHDLGKTMSRNQIKEEPMLVTRGLWFKFLFFNVKQHNPEGSGEQLQGHYGPLVDFQITDLTSLSMTVSSYIVTMIVMM